METYETMIDYSSLNQDINIIHPNDASTENSTFRETHCKNGNFTFKNMSVKPEMLEHIFPEIHFNGEKCNVCDSTCGFTLLNTPEQVISYRQEFGK
jgi:hypothetical protein